MIHNDAIEVYRGACIEKPYFSNRFYATWYSDFGTGGNDIRLSGNTIEELKEMVDEYLENHPHFNPFCTCDKSWKQKPM